MTWSDGSGTVFYNGSKEDRGEESGSLFRRWQDRVKPCELFRANGPNRIGEAHPCKDQCEGNQSACMHS